MPARDTVKSLRAEVEALKAEVEALRTWQASHVCQPPPVSWPQPTVGAATTTLLPWTNVCAGAGGSQVFTLPSNAAANPSAFTLSPSALTGGCAGGGALQSTWYTAGGDCA